MKIHWKIVANVLRVEMDGCSEIKVCSSQAVFDLDALPRIDGFEESTPSACVFRSKSHI